MYEFIITLIVVFLVTVFIIVPLLLVYRMSKNIYGERTANDYLYEESDFADLQFEKIDLTSEMGKSKYSLYGGIYSNKNVSKYSGVILLLAGIKTNHNEYLPEINYFTSRGYYVFTFDPSGTGKSGGEKLGTLAQLSKDAAGAYNAIKSHSVIKDLPLMVWGFALGAYTALSMLGQGYRFDGIAALAAFDNANKMTVEFVKRFIGIRILLSLPYIYLYNMFVLGKARKYTAARGLKSNSAPVILIHDKGDEIVPFKNFEKLKQFCSNPRSRFIVMTGRNHWIRYVGSAYKNREELKEKYIKAGAKSKPSMKRIYINAAKQIDLKLESIIVDFFDNTLSIQ